MPITPIDAKTLKQWMDAHQAVVVDVREPAEYASGHIEGSSLVPMATCCPTALPDAHGKKLVIHCRSGGRGMRVCEKLQTENPVLDIYHLQGGLSAWEAEGYYVARTGKKILPLDRQVQLTVGSVILISSLCAYFLSPSFALIPAFMGAGLAFAGLTGFCGLAMVLAKMPWNQRTPSATVKTCAV